MRRHLKRFKRRRTTSHSSRTKRPDYIILGSIIFLVLAGLIMLGSASSNLGKIRYDDSLYFVKHQIMYGLSLGIIGFIAGSFIYYRRYEKIAFPALIITIILLALVFTPLGISAKGAARWLQIGPITFQPSELLKLTFPMYIAAWLSRSSSERQKNFLKGLLPLGVVIAIIAGLLLKQPSTSMVAMLIAAGGIVYFMSGAKISYIFSMIGIGIAAILLISFITPYRWERIQTFLNPSQNTQDSGFHINQALIAIGSGGLTGVGFGESTTKIYYLPEPAGDSIFAVIAEEFGFIGASIFIAVFFILVLKTFLLAQKTSDKFARLLLIGFGSLIGIQAAVNIGAISGLLPLTGTPLPFISFGGTSLAVFMTMAGIIVNISRNA